MIIEVNKNNISILDDSFLDSEYITNELNMNPFAKIYVYVENYKVVGYIYYSDIYERVEINQIEVENIHRNCGLGTKLLKFVTENVDKPNCVRTISKAIVEKNNEKLISEIDKLSPDIIFVTTDIISANQLKKQDDNYKREYNQ